MIQPSELIFDLTADLWCRRVGRAGLEPATEGL